MSIRRLWTLGVALLVTFGAGLGVLANYYIDMYGAKRTGYEWLRGSRNNGTRAYQDELLDGLAADARALGTDRGTAEAIARGAWADVDDAQRRLWTERRPNEHWLVLRDGAVHGSLDGCRGPELVARLRRRDRGFALCGATPVFYASSDRPAAGGGPIYAVRVIDDEHAMALQRVSGTEVSILGPAGDVATSLRDQDGRPIRRSLDEAALSRLEVTEHDRVGTATLSVPSYAGYVNGAAPILVGARELEAYVLAAPLDPDDATLPVTIVLAAPRAVLDQGAIYSSLMLAATAVLIVALLAVLGRVLVGRITEPLARLGRAAESIGSGNTDVRVGKVGGGRELELVASAFDGMAEKLVELRRMEASAVANAEARADETRRALEQLRAAHEELRGAHVTVQETQEKLVRASRLAGMAEVASNVLHNVGNVLNTVNVAVEVAQRRAAGSKLATLERAVAMMPEDPQALAAFYAADPRAAQLPRLLRLLTDALVAERRAIGGELEVLTRSIDHIKNIVRRQQQMASFDGATEVAAPADVLEMAISLHGAGSGPRAIEIVREVEPLPARALDRHRMVQILLNLLSNARHAVHAASPGEPRIVVRLAAEDDGFRIEVADNGAGFPAELRRKIFEHGFTTKPDGHGFGLHSSANAAVEMGGTLTAHSDGPGRGATFVLHVPAAEVASRAAA